MDEKAITFLILFGFFGTIAVPIAVALGYSTHECQQRIEQPVDGPRGNYWTGKEYSA